MIKKNVGFAPRMVKKMTEKWSVEYGEIVKRDNYVSISQVFLGKETVPDKVGLERHNENMVRVYFSGYDSVNFQIRTHRPITDGKKAVPRDMIATVGLTLDELKELVQILEEQRVKEEEATPSSRLGKIKPDDLVLGR